MFQPITMMDLPEGIDAPKLRTRQGELREKIAMVETMDAELQDLKRKAEDDPLAYVDDIRRLAAAVLSKERDVHRELEPYCRNVQAACRVEFDRAEAEREAVGRKIFEGLVELGFPPGDVNPAYQHRRFGSLTGLVESHPAFIDAETVRILWHEHVRDWGMAASHESGTGIKIRNHIKQKMAKLSEAIAGV